MKLNRREFIKGLFLSAAALVLPKGSAAQAVEGRHSDHQLLSAVHTDYIDTVERGDIVELLGDMDVVYARVGIGSQKPVGLLCSTNGSNQCAWEVRTACKEPDGTPEYPVWGN